MLNFIETSVLTFDATKLDRFWFFVAIRCVDILFSFVVIIHSRCHISLDIRTVSDRCGGADYKIIFVARTPRHWKFVFTFFVSFLNLLLCNKCFSAFHTQWGESIIVISFESILSETISWCAFEKPSARLTIKFSNKKNYKW